MSPCDLEDLEGKVPEVTRSGRGNAADPSGKSDEVGKITERGVLGTHVGQHDEKSRVANVSRDRKTWTCLRQANYSGPEEPPKKNLVLFRETSIMGKVPVVMFQSCVTESQMPPTLLASNSHHMLFLTFCNPDRAQLDSSSAPRGICHSQVSRMASLLFVLHPSWGSRKRCGLLSNCPLPCGLA